MAVVDQPQRSCMQSVVGMRMKVGESAAHKRSLLVAPSVNMIVPRYFALFLLLLLTLVDGKPIHENIRQYEDRHRRTLPLKNWEIADELHKRFYEQHKQKILLEARNKRAEVPLELRPVGGPINIEQLPAMLAARYVRRYPFSQRDDPAIIGR